MTDADPSEIAQKRVCAACVGDAYLSKEIVAAGEARACDYCDAGKRTISIETLSEHVEGALDRHYRFLTGNPDGEDYLAQKYGDYNERGDPIAGLIQDIATVEDSVADDIAAILHDRLDEPFEENRFDDMARWEAEKEVNADEIRDRWYDMERHFQTQARFFSQRAEEEFDTMFQAVRDLDTHTEKPLVRTIGPETDVAALYRAREFSKQTALERAMERPDNELGPPPSALARAGRMNPHGIAIFYGATAPKLALDEIRPAVGAQVLVGAFEILRPLKILDVDALANLTASGSEFDPAFAFNQKYAAFFEEFHARISRAVTPDDEASDYLITQALAQYLSERLEPRLDGIMYGSAQSLAGGRNVALFHHAAKVKPLRFHKDAAFRTSTYSQDSDGIYPDYDVYVEEPERPDGEDRSEPIWVGRRGSQQELRQDTLQVGVESLRVHHVEGASVATSEHEVRWQRTQRPLSDRLKAARAELKAAERDAEPF